jgi:hypothetical protein
LPDNTKIHNNNVGHGYVTSLLGVTNIFINLQRPGKASWNLYVLFAVERGDYTYSTVYIGQYATMTAHIHGLQVVLTFVFANGFSRLCLASPPYRAILLLQFENEQTFNCFYSTQEVLLCIEFTGQR